MIKGLRKRTFDCNCRSKQKVGLNAFMNASCQEEHLSICLGFLPLAHSSRGLPAHIKRKEPWCLRVSIFLFQAFS